jgi:hypothetical protein
MKNLLIMKKSEKHQLVLDAAQQVKDELGSEIYSIIGVDQRLLRIQNKLPVVPLYGTAQIRQILAENNA